MIIIGHVQETASHVGEDPSQAALIAMGFGEPFGFA
jgi:hypothetical protein